MYDLDIIGRRIEELKKKDKGKQISKRSALLQCTGFIANSNVRKIMRGRRVIWQNMTEGIKEKQMEKKRKTKTKDKDEFLNEVLFSCGM